MKFIIRFKYVLIIFVSKSRFQILNQDEPLIIEQPFQSAKTEDNDFQQEEFTEPLPDLDLLPAFAPKTHDSQAISSAEKVKPFSSDIKCKDHLKSVIQRMRCQRGTA